MAKFVVRKKKNTNGPSEKILYYAVPVSEGVINVEMLSEHISEMCTLTAADVKATVTALSQMMRDYLQRGYTIHLDDIGHFSVSASSEGFETPEECTPRRVIPRRVCFKADKKLRNVLKDIKYSRRTFVRKRK